MLIVSLLYFLKMNRRIIKALELTAALVAGVFFALCTGMDAVLLMDYANQEVEVEVVIILLVLSFLFMLGAMTMINYTNRAFDGEHKKANRLKPGRWAMNTLFASMIMILIALASYGTVFSSSPLRAAPRARGPLVLFLALAAVSFYILNYHRLLPRRRQIHRAEKRYSLNGRRFTFLCEEISDDGFWKGKLSGEIHTGDKVLFLDTGGRTNEARVARIYAGGRKTGKASDSEIYLKLKSKTPAEEIPFSVVSGQRPVGTTTPAVAAENPRITGMLSGLSDHYDDSDFMSCFVYDFVHGHYLVPAKVGEKESVSSDITEAIRGSHDVMFLSVSSSREPDKTVLPIFTDWGTLSRYENVIEDEKSVVLLMSFQQAVEIMHKGYDGMVINPFNPASFYLSENYVHSITALEGYRREFVENQEN